jgi:hypothetical protein
MTNPNSSHTEGYYIKAKKVTKGDAAAVRNDGF